MVLLYGEAGTGKTRYVFEKHPDVFRVPSSDLKWFDSYDGHEVVLVDDYRGEAPESVVLQLLDIYPLQVPVKNGFKPFVAKRIFITTNYKPTDLHNFKEQASRDAWKRRIHRAVWFQRPMTTEEVDNAPNHWQ